jgi:hypothetical protein
MSKRDRFDKDLESDLKERFNKARLEEIVINPRNGSS